MSEADDDAAAFFRTRLLPWFAMHGRTFPWRAHRDPYHVLVAERMLHRTRADQVVPVYERFLSRYPSVKALASAAPEEVHAVLAPLGLGWRFASFVPMARRMVDEHGGQVPRSHVELIALPGVGPYVASAVLCFAFDEPVAVVDTNTIRVAGRYLAGTTWVADDRKKRHVQAAVARLLDRQRPVESNYAMLDLGALICTLRTPLCDRCPVIDQCNYHLDNRASHTGQSQNARSELDGAFTETNTTSGGTGL